LYVDQVFIIQGTLVNGEWRFSTNRLPSVPVMFATVAKKGSREHPENNSFAGLSAQARLFVLKAGTVKDGQCMIDEKYWFGN
ncbi:MAG: hypothetical protein JWM28_3126, partial [Chitinophagaceae bacterium]|nr:hypothetical protein [Chitinophagaceae bacterium]